jgi:hypothetical protein
VHIHIVCEHTFFLIKEYWYIPTYVYILFFYKEYEYIQIFFIKSMSTYRFFYIKSMSTYRYEYLPTYVYIHFWYRIWVHTFRIGSMDTYRYEYIPTYVYIHFDSMSTYFSNQKNSTSIVYEKICSSVITLLLLSFIFR